MADMQVEIVGRIPGTGNVPAVLIARRPADGAFAAGHDQNGTHFVADRWFDPVKALEHATKVLEGNARAQTQPGAFRGFAVVLAGLALAHPEMFFPPSDGAAATPTPTLPLAGGGSAADAVAAV